MNQRNRAGGRWTEARFWGFVRSALRAASVRWPPKADAMRAARRTYAGDNPRQKWEYLCANCGGWFAGKDVQLDHIDPCGELRDYSHIEGFVRRLFCEADGYRVLCAGCHAARKLGATAMRAARQFDVDAARQFDAATNRRGAKMDSNKI